MAGSYGELCTLFYDSNKPEAGIDEVDYYASLIPAHGKPALEAMCGSGRLMIPLLRRGLHVHGVDNSQAMLQSLKARCKSAGLQPPTAHCCMLENLAIQSSFQTVIVALGSFQLFVDEEIAGRALAALRAALIDGGRLVIQAFIPDLPMADQQGQRSVVLIDGSKIVLTTSIRTEPTRQVYHLINRYERVLDDVIVATEDEEFSVRWYSQQQLTHAFKVAGFEDIQLVRNYNERVEPSADAKFFLIEARKGR